MGGVYKYDVSIPLAEMYEMYGLVKDVSARLDAAGLLSDNIEGSEERPVIGVTGLWATRTCT